MNENQRRNALAMVVLLATGGCATGPNRNPQDPLEPLNRMTYRFNDALDRNFAQPVARQYNKLVPQPVRTAVDNFFANLGDVVVMANDFAQLRIADGMNDFGRVAFNTTFGVLGTIDIASALKMPRHVQDFGLTLAHYGVPSGPYLVLPLFGPSTFRDAAGFGVDQYASPITYADPAWRNSLWGVDFVSTRARYLNATSLLEEAALDRYLFTRDAWLGQREAKVRGEKEEKLPNYEKDQ
ncbi:hypothetical protein GCM10027321_26820 [Massilia terrae]|uniref:VacJ family lipoprotein n=1 Tax=Massilia terrae TaxID=1811224 RepID=A0ABT2CZD8_9BURK|nr:VacJ family lipoprotein [Massilia terrae]MCS0659170.1 VacJ family lipoprotein [Massilia terrae]